MPQLLRWQELWQTHTKISLISSRVASQALCFCLEMVLDGDVNPQSSQSAFKIHKPINAFEQHFTLHGIGIPGKLDKSSKAVCTSTCSGEKPQERSLEDCWPQFICFSYGVMAHLSSVALILLSRKNNEALYTKPQKNLLSVRRAVRTTRTAEPVTLGIFCSWNLPDPHTLVKQCTISSLMS